MPASPSGYVDVPRSSSPAHTIPRMLNLQPEATEDAQEIRPQWKRDLYMLLELPASSPAAFLIHVVTTAFIILSAIVTVLETMPIFHSIDGSVWFGMETSLVAMFTVEYIARCLAHSNTWRSAATWGLSFFGIIDLLGILPYYIEIALQQDTVNIYSCIVPRISILITIEVMFLSFKRSQHALLALSFFVVMVLIVFSTLLYFAERGTWDEGLGIFMNSDGDPSQFSSIPAAGWFVLVTITTVGYGEITPRSFLGRLVTLPLLVFGLLLIALPTFVLGKEFSLVWEMMKENQALEDGGVTATPLTSPQMRRMRAPSVISLETFVDDSRIFGGPIRRNTQQRDQAEMMSQIAELKATIATQGELIRRIMEAVEGKGKQRAQDASPSRGDGGSPMSIARPLEGKVAIITGSTRGIGAAIAQKLASLGANVVINYHKVDMAATRVAYGINMEEGGKAIVVKADVSTLEGGKKVLEECRKQLGQPNILVLNASVMGFKALADMNEEGYDMCFNTNVKGPLFMAKSAAETMSEGDRIIFVSTTITKVSNVLPIALLFAATKGAIEQIVRILAKDLGARGITVNAISPGPVDTPLFRAGKPAAVVRWIEQLHPQQRLPQPEEISPLVAFLASKDSGWVNGQNLGVNGAYVV
ncbi:hypothetical protein EIP91_001180 [Steccherinum ochraceum]|uniref:Ion transport domain-containing protein n=1 Tax=Steccherinum ochraceum TaxID=92696 RepID=A0A4R0RUL2_9APHY|nr:hypothetical protein EIP91_001180 [Steccherinum ochraceum]